MRCYISPQRTLGQWVLMWTTRKQRTLRMVSMNTPPQLHIAHPPACQSAMAHVWTRSQQARRACRASPQSLALTFEQLARGRRASWPDALRVELRMAAHLSGPHFPTEMHEGVRCALIERGAAPRWRYARVEDVPRDVVDAFFEPRSDVPDLELPSPRL